MTRHRAFARYSIAALTVLCAGAFAASVAQSQPKPITVTAGSDLAFGKFLVFGSGARQVSATGVVTNYSVFPVPGDAPSPAQFTVRYDRGNNARGNRRARIEVDLFITPPPPVVVDGVSARVSNFETDLPGVGRINPGQPFRLSMPDCRGRFCTQTFRVGGRLDVSRGANGAVVTIPLNIDAVVVEAE